MQAVKKTVEVLNRPHNKPLFDLVKSLVEQTSEEMLKRDGGFTPGFSIRLKAYVLDELADLFGERTVSHLVAVDEAWRELTAKTKLKKSA